MIYWMYELGIMYGPLILLDNKEGVQIMLSVLVPIVVLMVITMVKKIPNWAAAPNRNIFVHGRCF